MQMFGRFMGACVGPLMFLNIIGPVIAGLWLAVLGRWGLIGWGVLIVGLGTTCLWLAMIPGWLLGMPGVRFISRGRYGLAAMFMSAAGLYDIAVITMWCVGVLTFFGLRADATPLLPVLVWSYSVATAPISHMAKGEDPSSVRTWATEFCCQAGYIAMILALLLTGADVGQAGTIFALIMSLSVVLRVTAVVRYFRSAGLEAAEANLTPLRSSAMITAALVEPN